MFALGSQTGFWYGFIGSRFKGSKVKGLYGQGFKVQRFRGSRFRVQFSLLASFQPTGWQARFPFVEYFRIFLYFKN